MFPLWFSLYKCCRSLYISNLSLLCIIVKVKKKKNKKNRQISWEEKKIKIGKKEKFIQGLPMKANGKPTPETFTFISAVYLIVTPMWTVWCRQSAVNVLNSKNIAGKYHFNQLYAIDAYRRYRYTWALSQLRALSNKLCIRSVIRVGAPLVICEVLFGSLQGLECSKHEKPCRSSMNSITKVTCA